MSTGLKKTHEATTHQKQKNNNHKKRILPSFSRSLYSELSQARRIGKSVNV